LRKGLWVPILAALAVGWALFLFPVTALQFANDDRGTLTCFRVQREERFAITYQHSIYDQPVTEEFSVSPRGVLVLTGVRSPSGAVLEYFGFTDGRSYQPMTRTMDMVVFRVAAGAPQSLTLRGRRISFLEFGDHGDRVVARVASMPLGRYVAELLRQRARAS